MSKLTPVAGLAGVLAAALATAVSAADGRTTRIEPRPFYGAIVTIEEGVRVFRPLPPTTHVIVNPHGATPLSLGFNETTVNERSYNYHRHEHSGQRGGGSYGSGGFPFIGKGFGFGGRGSGGHGH